MTEALDRCVEDGVKEIVVQPTHLMAGLEYADVKDELDKYADKFDKISLGDPLLTSDDDYKKVAAAIKENMASFDDGKTALCLMGHGTEADSNADYAKMQEVFKNEGLTQFFVGTVEAEPTCEDVIAAASAAGYKKAVLAPFMVVAGVPRRTTTWQTRPDPDSWAAKFVAAGLRSDVPAPGSGTERRGRRHLRRARGRRHRQAVNSPRTGAPVASRANGHAPSPTDGACRCIRIPPTHSTARAVEAIERNPSMLKKTLAFALSAALFAFSLAGCGGNSIDSAKASDADSQEKTEQAADAPRAQALPPSPPTRWPTAPIRSP